MVNHPGSVVNHPGSVVNHPGSVVNHPGSVVNNPGYCTHLAWNARKVWACYASRWAIEVTFENSQQLLGLEDPANRTAQAVRRTAPMVLVLYSLIVAWFQRTGHRHVKFPDRPWYTTQREPTFGDLPTTLRRLRWQQPFGELLPQTEVVKKRVAHLTEFLAQAGSTPA